MVSLLRVGNLLVDFILELPPFELTIKSENTQ